jgi:hypothetical protein
MAIGVDPAYLVYIVVVDSMLILISCEIALLMYKSLDLYKKSLTDA